MRIGPYLLANNLFVAPMAGVTDRPFRHPAGADSAAVRPTDVVPAVKYVPLVSWTYVGAFTTSSASSVPSS